MALDKRSCMARAQALIANPTDENLRYAALELRLCIEALTYEKLQSFSNIIPEAVLQTWQPPQAVKALLEFEPLADQSFTIFAGIEETPGIESKNMKYVGKHSALRFKWLRKHYHKLGSLLHSALANSERSNSLLTTTLYLNEVINDLAEPLQGNILGGGFRTVYNFDCNQCKKPVICNKDAVAKTHKAVCFNPQCGMEYYASIMDDGSATFKPIITEFDCVSCKALTAIENRKLDIGLTFKCTACGQKHCFIDRQWGYGAVES